MKHALSFVLLLVTATVACPQSTLVLDKLYSVDIGPQFDVVGSGPDLTVFTNSTFRFAPVVEIRPSGFVQVADGYEYAGDSADQVFMMNSKEQFFSLDKATMRIQPKPQIADYYSQGKYSTPVNLLADGYYLQYKNKGASNSDPAYSIVIRNVDHARDIESLLGALYCISPDRHLVGFDQGTRAWVFDTHKGVAVFHPDLGTEVFHGLRLTPSVEVFASSVGKLFATDQLGRRREVKLQNTTNRRLPPIGEETWYNLFFTDGPDFYLVIDSSGASPSPEVWHGTVGR